MTFSILKPQSLASPPFHQWHDATWDDYVVLRDAPELLRLAFNQGRLWIEMSGEGINHAGNSDLFISLLFIWAIQHPGEIYTSLGRCLLEKSKMQASFPDLVLYVGTDYPQWQPGERRRIDLDQWRVPDLVGEVSDTTLASDLDEKKHLDAALGIPEYWVIDVQGQRLFAFLLNEKGQYQDCTHSVVLQGLAISLLEQTLQKLSEGSNTSAAAWFAQEIAKLSISEE